MLYAAVYLQTLMLQAEDTISRRLRDERGAVGVEYVALIALVVAVLGVVVGFKDEIGKEIKEKIIDFIGNIKE